MSPLSDTTVLAASVTDTPFHAYPVYALYDRSLYDRHTDRIQHRRILEGGSGRIPDSHFLRSLERLVPYHALAYDRTDRYRNHDRQEDTFDRGAFRLLHTRRNIRLDLPAKRLIGDFRITDSGIIAYIKGLLMTFYDSTQIQTGNEALNSLVSTREWPG